MTLRYLLGFSLALVSIRLKNKISHFRSKVANFTPVYGICFARMAFIHQSVEKLHSTKELYYIERIYLYRIECAQHRPDHGLSTQNKQTRVVYSNFDEQPAM